MKKDTIKTIIKIAAAILTGVDQLHELSRRLVWKKVKQPRAAKKDKSWAEKERKTHFYFNLLNF